MTTRTRLILALGAACAVAGAAVVPYQAVLIPEVAASPIPLWGLAIAAGLQTGLLCMLLAWIGLRAGDSVDLGAPALTAWLDRTAPLPMRRVAMAIGIGVLMGGVIGVVDQAVLLPLLPEPETAVESPGGLIALGASLYGAIVEEVLLRLFLLTVLAWLGSKVGLGQAAPWVALLASAVLFGVGHLPAAAALWPLTPLVVARIVGLNLALALPFGVAYLRHGVLMAMAMHFGADLGLHVLLPMVS